MHLHLQPVGASSKAHYSKFFQESDKIEGNQRSIGSASNTIHYLVDYLRSVSGSRKAHDTLEGLLSVYTRSCIIQKESLHTTTSFQLKTIHFKLPLSLLLPSSQRHLKPVGKIQ